MTGRSTVSKPARKSKAKKQTQIRLPDHVRLAYQKIADERGSTMSAVLQQAAQEWLVLRPQIGKERADK